MGRINKKRENAVGTHKNWMGGTSWDVDDPFLRLRLAASTCFFGEPMYYQRDAADHRPSRATRIAPARLDDRQLGHLRSVLEAIDPQEWRSMTPAALMESTIDAALDSDPERTLAEAARLRNEDHIRTTPQVILVRAANHPKARGTGLVPKFAPHIIKRADEPSVGLAYQLGSYGPKAPIPNSLKKAWKASLENFDEYQLAKYRMASREVALVDVMNLVHPKSAAIDKLAKGELSLSGKTWEAIVSAKNSSKESWLEAIEVMGHMALLRNVRNFIEKEIEPARFVPKLVEGAETGQQLPFRYWSAYRAAREASAPGVVLDAIEACLMKSVGNLPRFRGKTISLVDNSGSARGATTSSLGRVKVCDIGNLTGILTGMVSDEGEIGIFGDGLRVLPVRKMASVFDQLRAVDEVGNGIGGGTENGIWLFFRDAIREKKKYDQIFVYSDMQAGHGGLYGTRPEDYARYGYPGSERMIDVASLVKDYRKEVNPDVDVFLVQIAGYHDTLIPEFYNRTYILGGWGEGILRFAHYLRRGDAPDASGAPEIAGAPAALPSKKS